MDDILKLLEEIRDELRLLRVQQGDRPLNYIDLGLRLRSGRDSLTAARAYEIERAAQRAARRAEQAQTSPTLTKAVDTMIEASLAHFLSQENQPDAQEYPASLTSVAETELSNAMQSAQP